MQSLIPSAGFPAVLTHAHAFSLLYVLEQNSTENM